MGWIFDTCTDEIGSCIRQYVMFGLSLIVFILSAYSCFAIRRRQDKLPFELLPLFINTVTSLTIFIAYTQMQVFNIRIILLIVQLYSYFILTYGFVFMALKRNSDFSNKWSKRLQRIFIIISIIFLLSIIATIILSSLTVIDCNEDQDGAGPIIIIALEIPLFIVAIIFSRKSKALLLSRQSKIDRTQYTHKTYHLINQQDQQKRIKINQINLVLYAFVVSFVLHAIEIYCYQIEDQQIICSKQTNRIQINSQLQLYIFWIQNISQLFPQIIIPVIFWYLPARMSNASVTIFMTEDQFEDNFHSRNTRNNINTSGQVKMNRQQSSLDVKSQEEIRFKLHQNLSPQRHARHNDRISTI